MPIAAILTPQQPFGPVEQDFIRDDPSAAELLEFVAPFVGPIERQATIILGRKGSGKTSILSGYQFAPLLVSRDNRSTPAKLPTLDKNGDFCIPVTTFDHFHEMVRTVAAGVYSEQNTRHSSTYAPVPVEVIEARWLDAIWYEVFKFFYRLSRSDDNDYNISEVVLYFSNESLAGLEHFDQSAANSLVEDAKLGIMRFLNQVNKRCLVLFDNMEDYPVTNPIFEAVLSGFLRCIGRFSQRYDRIEVIFCFPEEIETYITPFSSNILKDYQRATRLRWKPSDLWTAALHRYRLFLQIYDPPTYERTKEYNIFSSSGRRFFLRTLFPSTITNSLGMEEDPVAYITRHTHLLPRHLIAILNRVATKSHQSTQLYHSFSPTAVTEGVYESEEYLAQQILALYRQTYPDLVESLREVMAELQTIFTYGELDKISRRLRGNGLSKFDRWRVMHRIGIVGRVESETDRYVFGAFHFCGYEEPGFASPDMYCFNPIFSRFYGCRRRDRYLTKTVYPARIDVVSLDNI